MPYTFEDFYEDLIIAHKTELVKRLSPSDVREVLSPEDLLKILSPEDRLKGLSSEEIETYLQKIQAQQSNN